MAFLGSSAPHPTAPPRGAGRCRTSSCGTVGRRRTLPRAQTASMSPKRFGKIQEFTLHPVAKPKTDPTFPGRVPPVQRTGSEADRFSHPRDGTGYADQLTPLAPPQLIGSPTAVPGPGRVWVSGHLTVRAKSSTYATSVTYRRVTRRPSKKRCGKDLLRPCDPLSRPLLDTKLLGQLGRPSRASGWGPTAISTRRSSWKSCSGANAPGKRGRGRKLPKRPLNWSKRSSV